MDEADASALAVGRSYVERAQKLLLDAGVLWAVTDHSDNLECLQDTEVNNPDDGTKLINCVEDVLGRAAVQMGPANVMVAYQRAESIEPPAAQTSDADPKI